jgi:hypothetical protein
MNDESHITTPCSALSAEQKNSLVSPHRGDSTICGGPPPVRYERTGDIRKVQRLLGHASPQQSWWYLGNAAIELDKADLQEPEPRKEKSA